MKTFLLLIVAVSTLALYSCTNDNNQRCKDFSNPEKAGYSFAKRSYKDFGGIAHFGFYKVINNHSIIFIGLMSLDSDCYPKEYFTLRHIPLIIGDTILLKTSDLSSSTEFATTSFVIKGGIDAIIERYDILEGKGLKNWVYIDYISPDTTYIEGRFNLSFVTTYKPYLTGERERWDDPNRPDTLHFTDGVFRAVLEKN